MGAGEASEYPASVELEAGIIGALLQDSSRYDAVAAKLRPEHFFEPTFGRILTLIEEFAATGRTISPVSVWNVMKDDEGLTDLGGAPFLARLTGDVGIFFALGEIDHLIELYRRRQAIQGLKAGIAGLGDLAVPVNAALEVVETALASADDPGVEQRTYPMDRAFSDAIDRIGKLARNEIPPGVLIHGLQDWNDVTAGMKPGQYIVVGGRPGMGKTALALSVSWRAALAGHGVLFITREMDITELMPRILADLLFQEDGQSTFPQILKGDVAADDMRLLRRIEEEASNWPLVFVDPAAFTAAQLNPLIRRHRREFERRGHSLDLVVIDYLGLIDPPEDKPNREQQVSAMSRTLKASARINKLPVIVLSQLSRQVEQRDDKRPQLSDLRDSGSLEQDADIVVFTYRDEYYLDRREPDRMDVKKRDAWELEMQAARNRIDIYSAKHRQGALVRRKGFFFGPRQAIRNSDYYRDGGFL